MTNVSTFSLATETTSSFKTLSATENSLWPGPAEPDLRHPADCPGYMLSGHLISVGEVWKLSRGNECESYMILAEHDEALIIPIFGGMFVATVWLAVLVVWLLVRVVVVVAPRANLPVVEGMRGVISDLTKTGPRFWKWLAAPTILVLLWIPFALLGVLAARDTCSTDPTLCKWFVADPTLRPFDTRGASVPDHSRLGALGLNPAGTILAVRDWYTGPPETLTLFEVKSGAEIVRSELPFSINPIRWLDDSRLFGGEWVAEAPSWRWRQLSISERPEEASYMTCSLRGRTSLDGLFCAEAVPYWNNGYHIREDLLLTRADGIVLGQFGSLTIQGWAASGDLILTRGQWGVELRGIVRMPRSYIERLPALARRPPLNQSP